MKQMIAQSLDPYLAESRLITDNPDKLLEEVSDDQKIVAREIRDALAAAEREMYIFTPYFVPRKGGIEFIKQLRAKGIRIVLLTNSLATNNHTAVHSAYATYRKDRRGKDHNTRRRNAAGQAHLAYQGYID